MSRSAAPLTNWNEPENRAGFIRRGIAWLFSQRHFHFKLLSGTAAGVIVIIFLAGVFLYITLHNHYQATARAHTIEVMRLSGVIENDIAALESGHRGFLLTGKPAYIESFDRRRDLIKQRIDDLTALILENPKQRKRVMKVHEVVQNWIRTVALPEINANDPKNAAAADDPQRPKSLSLGNSLLNQAREILQSLQDEEQIVLNQRMMEQEWATQSIQILEFLPKLERSVLEMEKEKRGYFLTGDAAFAEAYKRAVADFYTYNGYLSILVATSPGQAELLAEIRSGVEQWINTYVAPEMEAKRLAKEKNPALADSGEALMAEIHQTLSTFEKNELDVYEVRAVQHGSRTRRLPAGGRGRQRVL